MKWDIDRRRRIPLDFDKFLERKFEKGEEILKLGIKRNPENKELYKKLGILYLESESLDKLEHLFENIAVENPGFKDAHYFLAYVHYKKMEFKKAEREFELAKGAMSGKELMRIRSFVDVFKYLEDKRIRKKKAASGLGYSFIDLSFWQYYAFFKGKNDLINLEIYYKIPFTDLHKNMFSDKEKLSFNQKGFIINEYNEIIDEYSNSIDIPFNFLPLDVTSTMHMETVYSNENRYLILLFEEINEAFSGNSKVPIKIKNFDTFSMSDIILGEQVESSGNLTGRSAINPEASLIFSGDSAALYFEIYNSLLKSGISKVHVTLEIYNSDKSLNRFALISENELKEIQDTSKPIIEKRISCSNGSSDIHFLQNIDISSLNSGMYTLIIKAEDYHSGFSYIAGRSFKVVH